MNKDVLIFGHWLSLSLAAVWTMGCVASTPPAGMTPKDAGASGGETGGAATGGSGGSSGDGPGGDPGGGSGGLSGSGGAGPTGSGGSPPPEATDGGADRPGATGAPGCQGVTARFCSDFEQQIAGGAPSGNGDFTADSTGITVDGTKGYSGTKSLHFKPTGNTAQLKFSKQFPFTEQHGRLMMWMSRTPTTGSHWDIVESDSAASNQWAWGGQNRVFELVVDPPDDGIDSRTAFPDGKWVCIQWTFSPGTGGKSEYVVKTDGVPVNPCPVIGRWKAGAWKDLLVGWTVFGSAPAVEFWIDDLAFGEQEIACPAPAAAP
jgi:hypothetical protein